MPMDKVTEVRRRHPGIAAVLIDLVRGRLDQRERCAGTPRVAQRRLDHQRMRRTDGKYPAGLARLVAAIRSRMAFIEIPRAISPGAAGASKHPKFCRAAPYENEKQTVSSNVASLGTCSMSFSRQL